MEKLVRKGTGESGVRLNASNFQATSERGLAVDATPRITATTVYHEPTSNIKSSTCSSGTTPIPTLRPPFQRQHP
jgi:hypothetical protein